MRLGANQGADPRQANLSSLTKVCQHEVQQTIKTNRNVAGNLSDRISIALAERKSAEI